MELKKQERKDTHTQETKSAIELTSNKFKAREWIEDLKHEVQTIHWTSQDELRVYTQIVVGATFFFGMGVYLVDLTVHGALNTLTWISRLLVG